MNKTALITGINGQDGSYLAELLLTKNYQIIGIYQNESNDLNNLKNIQSKIDLICGDLSNTKFTDNIFQNYQIDECFHLAASTFVNNSLSDDLYLKNNFISSKNLLDSLIKYQNNSRFFLAGSSEMFGNTNESPQNEKSLLNPQNIYGITKLKSYEYLKKIRQENNIFACCGFLYNHESIRRNPIFVTRKITQNIAKIKLGISNIIELGDIESSRDFGYAKEFVEAMHLMMNNSSPQDYVIASGKIFKIREILEMGFEYVKLNYLDYLKINSQYIRSASPIQLIGDTKKIYQDLNWQAKTPIQNIIYEMIENDIELIKNKIIVK